jgi:hypothetical protein
MNKQDVSVRLNSIVPIENCIQEYGDPAYYPCTAVTVSMLSKKNSISMISDASAFSGETQINIITFPDLTKSKDNRCPSLKYQDLFTLYPDQEITKTICFRGLLSNSTVFLNLNYDYVSGANGPTYKTETYELVLP